MRACDNTGRLNMASSEKRILITGANGLLGKSLLHAGKGRHTLLATGRGPQRGDCFGATYAKVDLMVDGDLQRAMEDFRPDAVIHAAAMTQVDDCERNPNQCQALNVEATANVIAACESHDAHLLLLSTDFIFDGKDGPYAEDAEANPLSVYGQSKLDAETLVKASACAWTIARTILVIGYVPTLSRSNIILWAREALAKGQRIQVVNDQYRSPTWSMDLAEACLQIIDSHSLGTYHISGPESMSILDLVHRVARHAGLDAGLIDEVSSQTLSQVAARPPVTGFNIDKAKKDFSFSPHSFAEVLDAIPYI